MATIQAINFENFKKFSRFSISCRDTNILVGPNNAGKSSTLDALRIFRDVHRYASRTKSVLKDHGSFGVCATYEMSQSLIGIPIDNVVRDYGDEPARISVKLTNDSTLHVELHPDQLVTAFVEADRAIPRTTVDFKRLFPIDLVIVPTLSALEDREPLVRPETATRNENTRLASRNFRNILYQKPRGEFDKFVQLCKEGWEDIELEYPEIVRGDPAYVTMMYREKRIPRELYWSGFGFQVWMQMMAQFLRGNGDSILVLDEPDIYLHPELQKRVLRMAKEKFGQIFIATHSTEIMNESEPGDIVSIVYNNRTAIRITTEEGYKKVYSYLGSSENAEFARLARAERIIFFEGKERNLIRKFAIKAKLGEMFQNPKTVYLQAGGFSQWTRVKEVDWALHNIFDINVKIAALFDRDYRCDEEIQLFKTNLENSSLWIDVLGRKEIENYALVYDPLSEAIKKRVRSRGNDITSDEVSERIVKLSDTYRTACQAQHLAHYLAHHREVDRRTTDSTHLERASERFEAYWADIDKRFSIIPGKEFIAVLSAGLQRDYGVSLTINQIVDEMGQSDVPPDLVDRLSSMTAFFN
ncbi:ATP-binding protein [Mesorhizobium sp. B2-4-13]|uniref:ATP-dependent nuclease n=1 Tax=Mesorhizobium sp. B2-4-13 TaxID=2589936 RepID=UPI0011504456|nr:ATP-binding protein [Mesorhizobium sp. B2-4-13]TPK86655.1 ATP-binding protein [Mesorhizobium sp. B2-4-13]